MMWKEFEEIAGYEVSYEDYHQIIEPMYLAIPEGISKTEFVKMLDKKRFALPTANQMLREVKKEAQHLFEICGHYTDYDSERRLDEKAKAYAKRKYGIDWTHDSKAFVFFVKEYEFPSLQRGCTYPKILVIGRGGHTYERTMIVK